jgi:hypothetical protein
MVVAAARTMRVAVIVTLVVIVIVTLIVIVIAVGPVHVTAIGVIVAVTLRTFAALGPDRQAQARAGPGSREEAAQLLRAALAVIVRFVRGRRFARCLVIVGSQCISSAQRQ